ncbi:alpha/beta hydrolase [Microvirga subterranea]|uniref:Acetyl esterase n=1 Tax=Microvirga subterranea TaxID=186651 RepID=A0A370HV48_9HYPH|nr:alpha/beta hydrolase [Microvirga subterranea]RDI60804.1 acetyl esterase [Microvirga subterranea]
MNDDAAAARSSATPVDQRTDGPGISHIDPLDPAARYFQLLAKMRTPMTLRDIMIQPVRHGYISHSIEPADLPPSASQLYPEIEVSDIYVPSAAGPIRCQVYRPRSDEPLPMMLYAHGGGFTVGSSEDTAYITSRLASDNRMVVVSVNYRLAPEWPFPAGLDDCAAVFGWLRQNGRDVGGDPSWIAVGGDSAGGNMAAALPIKIRDEGDHPPEAAVLMCPITSFFVEEHESFERLAPLGIIYDTAFVGYIRGAYAVHYRNWSHPHVSPALADLRGYPPTIVVSGTADPIVDDNLAFVRKLRDSGNGEVVSFVRERMPHGYYFFPGLLKEGDEAFDAIAEFLKSKTPRKG